MSNLISTQKARTIFNIGNLTLTIRKRYIIALLMTMGALFAYSKQDNIKHYIGWNKAFPKNDKRFKVLLLPFKQLCDDKRDVGDVVKDRLEQLSKDDTLDIGVHYADIPISNSFNDDSANYYMEYHRADFVIYGQYQDKNCTGKGKDEYCMNFQTSPNWAKEMQEKQSKNTEKTMQMGFLDDIRNGNLTVNVEFVLYYVAGKANYQKADFRKSVAYFTKVIKRKKGDALTYNNRGNAYRNLEQYDKAIADYNKAIALNPNDVNAYNNRRIYLLGIKPI
ncbi:MAG TPA: tetratricopeptide repeat protein [Chitinophagales bacterium]|nr:tetratricopeptide repeat protein [Chitinophagales bacterium]